jgi:hypothetical protein
LRDEIKADVSQDNDREDGEAEGDRGDQGGFEITLS